MAVLSSSGLDLPPDARRADEAALVTLRKSVTVTCGCETEEGEADLHSVLGLCSNSLKLAETFFHIKLAVYLDSWDSGLWWEDPGLG